MKQQIHIFLLLSLALCWQDASLYAQEFWLLPYREIDSYPLHLSLEDFYVIDAQKTGIKKMQEFRLRNRLLNDDDYNKKALDSLYTLLPREEKLVPPNRVYSASYDFDSIGQVLKATYVLDSEEWSRKGRECSSSAFEDDFHGFTWYRLSDTLRRTLVYSDEAMETGPWRDDAPLLRSWGRSEIYSIKYTEKPGQHRYLFAYHAGGNLNKCAFLIPFYPVYIEEAFRKHKQLSMKQKRDSRFLKLYAGYSLGDRSRFHSKKDDSKLKRRFARTIRSKPYDLSKATIICPIQIVVTEEQGLLIEETILAWPNMLVANEKPKYTRLKKVLPKTFYFGSERFRTKKEKNLGLYLLRRRKIDKEDLRVLQDSFFYEYFPVVHYSLPQAYGGFWGPDSMVKAFTYVYDMNNELSEKQVHAIKKNGFYLTTLTTKETIPYEKRVRYRYPVIDERGNWLLRVSDAPYYQQTIRYIEYWDKP